MTLIIFLLIIIAVGVSFGQEAAQGCLVASLQLAGIAGILFLLFMIVVALNQ